MSQFEFLTVIISIVLAFGISDILSSWGEQIRLRREIRPYGLHLAWTVLLFLVMVQAWWGLWLLRDLPGWTFPAYLLLILPYLTLALIAYLLTPEFSEGERDIRRCYSDMSPWSFSLGAFYLAMRSVFSLAIYGETIGDMANVLRNRGDFDDYRARRLEERALPHGGGRSLLRAPDGVGGLEGLRALKPKSLILP